MNYFLMFVIYILRKKRHFFLREDLGKELRGFHFSKCFFLEGEEEQVQDISPSSHYCRCFNSLQSF